MSAKLAHIDKPKNQFILIGVVVSLIFPVCAWMLDLIAGQLPVSIETLFKIHAEHPGLFLIDLIPIITGFGLHFLFSFREKEHIRYNTEIQKRNELIQKNADFAKKIGQGDYTSHFETNGEADELGRSLLLMRENLLLTTRKEAELSWIAAGKDQISNILRIHNKIDILAYETLISLTKYINAVQGAFYLFDEDREVLTNISTYAYNRKKYISQEFRVGQGLIGQCAYEMDIVYRTEIPDDYATISSGILGDKKPKSILIVPLVSDEKLQGVIEFAFLLDELPELTLHFMKELGEIIARTIFNLRVSEQTERLLEESREMTVELQENEEELRQSAEEMRATQEELQRSNENLETQIDKVENAQKRLHSLLENASEVISIYDENQELTYISPSVTTILGYTPDEMMKGKDFDRLTRKGETEIRNMFKELLEDPSEPITIQYTYLKKDGQKIFLETTGRNLLPDPAIKGIILNSQDITERKRAEKEERMKSKMQALSENSLDMILRLNIHGMFFYANPVVEDYIGVRSVDLMNKTIGDIELPENLREYFKSTLSSIKASPSKRNNQITIDIKIGVKTLKRIMSIDAIPEFNENELETVLFVAHDITEAKRIELEIADKNRKLEDSINYAQRIQSAILPDNKLLRESLPKSFIFYKPRDVVSGDFPWFFKREGVLYIAAVDCTGHGVPGALLSFIGYFILNNIVDHEREYSAGEVCDLLHNGVRHTLRQNSDDADGRDGMDLALVKIDPRKNEIHFAGAHRPLYMLRNGELIEYKGDRKAIGGIPLPNRPEKNFTDYVIPTQQGDKIFFFSDGLTDQLGGPIIKKFSPGRVRELISSNPDFSMEEYNSLFERTFSEWQGDQKQIDDVLLIGIEF
ncbi:MAG: PAS domain S-box protein [Bacteroidota bacterium]|nr:PAS domain S-box protein [Bacteroidota bacterium]